MPVIRKEDAQAVSRGAIVLDLGDLHRQGEAIIAQAQQKADEILKSAERQRQRLLEGAAEYGRTEGYAKGLADGHEQGVAEWRWNQSYAPHSIATAAAERVREALEACAQEGRTRVAIYGSGSHTQRAAHALAEPPVSIAAIIDDNESRQGRAMWGFPIVSLEHAGGLGLDAVVISSDAHEPAMYKRCRALESRGVTVVRLYDDANEEARS